MKDQFPYLTDTQLSTLDSLYPNPNQTCPNTGCYWRQLADVYGETRYMCPSLFISRAYTAHAPEVSNYAYRYNVLDPKQEAEGRRRATHSRGQCDLGTEQHQRRSTFVVLRKWHQCIHIAADAGLLDELCQVL